MQQKVLTFTKRFIAIDQYHFNLNDITKKLNDEGWMIKQVVSTSFEHHIAGQEHPWSVFAVTLLVEHD